jgi:hypothetical protein
MATKSKTTRQAGKQTAQPMHKVHLHRAGNDVYYYFGPRASDIDRKCDPDNPFLKREQARLTSTRFGAVTAALDMPLFMYRVFPDGHEKRIQIPLRVDTPYGKGTIWQSWPQRMGVQLDCDLTKVVYITGEQLEQIEPLYERIYEQPFFAQWVLSL